MPLRRLQGRAYRLARRVLPPLGAWRKRRRPFFEALDQLLDSEGTATFGLLVDRAGEQTYGLVILLLSLPSLIPGLNVGAAPVGGLGLVAVGLQMLLGRDRPWIPAPVRAQPIHKGRVKATLLHFERVIQRLRLVNGRRRSLHPRWTGFLVAWTGILLALPVPLPFANMIPAAVLSVLGLALLEERPAWSWAGAAGALACTLYFGLSWGLVLHAITQTVRALLPHLR